MSRMVIKEHQRRASINQIADFLERYLNVHIEYYNDSYLKNSNSTESVASNSPGGLAPEGTRYILL
jgi:hypothetical protein